MKRIKKIIAIALTLLCTVGLTPVMATSAQSDPATDATSSSTKSKAGLLRADEWVYYYRNYNGIDQYRIWNATRGKWITEWINC